MAFGRSKISVCDRFGREMREMDLCPELASQTITLTFMTSILSLIVTLRILNQYGDNNWIFIEARVRINVEICMQR